MSVLDEVCCIFDTVLVLDFGSQYSHLIIRALRELNVYAEMLPCSQKMSELSWKPKGIILSGGPYSVYAEDAPHVDQAVFDLDIPILGICYGLQEIAWVHSAKVYRGDRKEYGSAILQVEDSDDPLFKGIENSTVWMSHFDVLHTLPEGFKTIASSINSPYCGIVHKSKPIYGIQFHPEVTHSFHGKTLLKNFVIDICKAEQNWTMENFIETEIRKIRTVVGPTARVIGAVSGGVDSTVAASLMKEAIGDRFHAFLVDNGLLRVNEAQNVKKNLGEGLGINLTVVDASEEFIHKLEGVTDHEKKRKIIGNTFIHVFEREAARIHNKNGNENDDEDVFLLQGTLYPDVIESTSFKGLSQTIKNHHNVGGLLQNMKFKLIEPFRELFKDEVRKLGEVLGIPHELVWKHPFPGPGFAIRILGEVTRSQIELIRKADEIYIDEIRKAGLYYKIAQAFACLLPIRTVGVMGDQRTYDQVIVLRAVESTDFMTADWFPFEHDFLKKVVNRIINEIDGVSRVTYDITSKPPATIEWE